MQITTYLGFTLLSILIQFGVMDFIQGRLKVEDYPGDLKGTSQKRQLRDVLKDITYKPHALYYQTLKTKLGKNQTPAKFLSNNSLTELLASTEISTTVLDILYEDNSTTTDMSFTTESLYTTTDFDNITEITFFESKNETATKPHTETRKTILKECKCNILYKVCDINCCCDSDCLDSEITLFPNCAKEVKKVSKPNGDVCNSDLPLFGYGNGLFCIVKTNMPDGNNIIYSEIDVTPTDHFLTWKSIGKPPTYYEYINKFYKFGDPVWILKNGSIYHIDLPAPMINNYCSGRKPMQFLNDEKYECNVNIRDLEMLQISKSLEEAAVISATPLSMNSSVLNCTNLHCVNWTIMACNQTTCTNYRKDLHEASCTERICVNIALRIGYTFYYYDSKIINASIKFYIQNITRDLLFMVQAIEVNFILGNESMDEIIRLSGNPGYMNGLPIIVSYAAKNHTEAFFNTTKQTNKYLALPENINGLCISSNRSQNFILFGKNRRMKCRSNHEAPKGRNSTDECKIIQNSITNLMDINLKALVSPLGNPRDFGDKDWLPLEKYDLLERSLYGEIHDSSRLHCFNLITRYSLVFSFAHLNGNSRILSCMFTTSAVNTTFSLDDLSTVITIDINFVDVTKPGVMEYAAGPNLNIHLPKDFFYPFRSNESQALHCNLLIIILHCLTMIVSACK